MTDEQLYTELQQFTAAAREVTEGLPKGKGTLGQLLNNPESARQLEASLKNLTAITDKINTGQGSIGQLMNDPALAKNLTARDDELREHVEQAEPRAGHDGEADERRRRSTSGSTAVTTHLEQLTTKLNQGQGTAGQADERTSSSMTTSTRPSRRCSDLLADIRKDPKKFLNVKISIF